MSSKEKSLEAKIVELEAKIKNLKSKKKYGLVWEDKPEDVVEICKTNIPVLKEVKEKEIIKEESKPINILIEGDNYHSLSILNYTHKGKFDAIYADPPYNTGATDWKYNNDYVDKNDTFRHSKWISFMEKRLRLAKDLLKEDGIICITIDDYEVCRLLMLMENIFGEDNHLGTIPIRNNPAGRSTVSGISITHEYAIFFGKTNKSKVGRLERNQKQIDRYGEEDDKGKFEWVNFRKPGSMKIESPKMSYPIFATKDNFRLPKMKWNEDVQEWDLLEKPNKQEQIIYPIDEDGKERRWRWGVERFISENEDLAVKMLRGRLHIYVKGRINEEGVLPMTWWDKKEYSSTAYGTNLLKNIFAELQIFSYPKSLYAVMDCLTIMTEKKDAEILDFFAGSGTTGHAVLELNKQDGGNRKFILCTNNENDICESVTYERIKRVINGYKNKKKESIEGLVNNLKYYKTILIPKSFNRDEMKIRITEECTEMLCILEGVYKEVKNKSAYKIFKRGDKILAVYYFLSPKELINLKKDLDKLNGEKVLYCFTLDSLGLNEEDFDNWKNVRLEAIPQKILDIYKEINEY